MTYLDLILELFLRALGKAEVDKRCFYTNDNLRLKSALEDSLCM